MSDPFPHRYRIRLEGASPGGALLTAPPRPVIRGGPPPEFDGDDAHWSPEHLLLGSLSLCYGLTVQALANRKKMTLSGFQADTEGIVEKTTEGLRFTRITIHAGVQVPSGTDPARAEELLQSAKRYCLVSNSLCAVIEVEGQVTSVA